jgi:hypothetical protein
MSQRLLPFLSTYLGHVDIVSTQLYLTMTPEMLVEANKRVRAICFRGGESWLTPADSVPGSRRFLLEHLIKERNLVPEVRNKAIATP